MKKILTLVAFATLTVVSYAQDAQKAAEEAAVALTAAPDTPVPVEKPNYWKKSLMTNINFTQTSLKNWAAGGYDNYTLAGYVDANANYAKEKMIWNNRLQMDYGFLYSEDKPIFQKNKDRIYFESKWGYETPIRHLSYSASFDFKTQFDDNFNYKNPTDAQFAAHPDDEAAAWRDARILKSGLFSPAYINLGIGLLWTPYKWLSINFAPVNGGYVVVQNEELRKTYGMELRDSAVPDTEGKYKDSDYKSARFELGAQLKTDVKFTVNDNINFTSQLVLFSNYLKNPLNPRINWDNKVFWKLAKYFALTFSTNMIWDETVLIKDDDYPDGHKAVQFKEFFEFGFSYTFATKKK